MSPPAPLGTTATVVLPGVVLRSVLEGVSVLLTGASALEFMLVEFHDISISMLMNSNVSSA